MSRTRRARAESIVGADRALLGALTVYGVVTFGWRTALQWRRTGDAGFRLSPGSGSNEHVASALITAGAIGGFAAAARSTRTRRRPVCRAAGIATVLGATALTVRAQLDLGDSWRIGVDETESTLLVTDGLFASVRNPIFSGIAVAAFGALIARPDPVSVSAFGAMLAGIELQVRRVEEPYLRAVHGERFDAYARTVGRFLPRRSGAHQVLDPLAESVPPSTPSSGA